jgi:hypothetical protein
MRTQFAPWLRALPLLLIATAFCFPSPDARAQGTAFTYNGRLNVNGAPVTGCFDLSFTLYDAATNGTAVGALTNSATPVTNGLFTVTLDLGDVFNGASYWLQLAARTNGGTSFTPLSPLQPITPTPYAIYSANAGTAASATNALNLSPTAQAQVNAVIGASNSVTLAMAAASGSNAASAAVSAAQKLGTYRGIVTTRCSHMGVYNGSDTTGNLSIAGVDTNDTYTFDACCTANCSNPSFVFGNSCEGTNFGRNPILVKFACVNTRLNVTNAVYFSGQRQVWIQPGQFIQSDILPVNWLQGDNLKFRCNVQVGGNGVYWRGPITQFADEGIAVGADDTDSGAIPQLHGVAYGPMLVLGDLPTGTPTIAINGDSIVQDSQLIDPTLVDNSFFISALGTNFGSRFGHVQLAMEGDCELDFFTPGNGTFRKMLMTSCNYVLDELGVNDLAYVNGHYPATNEIAADKIGAWNYYTQAGKQIITTTLCPHGVQSTDGFATTNNQQLEIYEPTRQWVNTWMRNGFAPGGPLAVAYPNVKLLDYVTNVEVSGDDGYWIAGYTLDGTHPKGLTVEMILSNYVATVMVPMLTNYYNPNFTPTVTAEQGAPTPAVYSGNGAGLTNISAGAITGGYNTNLVIGGHTFYITNGLIMYVQ